MLLEEGSLGERETCSREETKPLPSPLGPAGRHPARGVCDVHGPSELAGEGDNLLGDQARFLERVEMAIRLARRHGDYGFAVLAVDLDSFKRINEGFGHESGDAVLGCVGRRIASCLREVDSMSRLSGDEFAVLLSDTTSTAQIAAVVERIHEALASPLRCCGLEIVLQGAVGVIPDGSEYDDAASLLKDAEIAMYRAKQSPGEGFTIFDREANERARQRMRREGDLRHALERGELTLYYQPILDLGSGTLAAAEALVRWVHPEQGLLPPSAFIPLAEESDLICRLDEEVLRLACARRAAWSASGEGLGAGSGQKQGEGGVVSVNLSARFFLCHDAVGSILRALADYGLAGSCLRVEVTETLLLGCATEATRAFERLREAGVELAMDDFGTGYASMASLLAHPFQVLKIDRSFISELCNSPRHRAAVRSVLSLAQGLGMHVVAEGVEEAEQAETLRSMGCHQVQGYHYARPMEAEVFENWVRLRGTRPLRREG